MVFPWLMLISSIDRSAKALSICCNELLIFSAILAAPADFRLLFQIVYDSEDPRVLAAATFRGVSQRQKLFVLSSI